MKNLKKIKWYLIFISCNGYLFFVSISNVNAQEIQDLYYCNDNLDLNKIYIMGNNRFLGHFTSNNNNGLILFDQHNLPKDTLNIGDDKYHYLQNLTVIDENNFYYSTLNSFAVCNITNNKFVITEEVQNLREFPQPTRDESDRLWGHYFKFKEIILIDKPTSKRMNAQHEYWLIFDTKEPKEIQLNEGIGEYYKKNWGSASTGSWEVQFSSKSNFVLKNDILAGYVYAIDTENKSVKRSKLPRLDKKKESWYVFLDIKTDNLYAVKFTKKKNEPNQLYSYDLKSNQINFIKDLNYMPLKIYDGSIYYETKQKLDKNQRYCFYKKPIYGTSKKIQVDEEVNIRKN